MPGKRGGFQQSPSRPTISSAPSRLKSEQIVPEHRSLRGGVADFLDRATFGVFSPGLTFETGRPVGVGSPYLKDTNPPTISDLQGQVQQNVSSTTAALGVTQELENVPLPFQARAALQEFRGEKEQELLQISQDLEALENSQSAITENFEIGGAFLEAMGLPATVDSAREDPEIAAAIDAVTAALDTGEGLDSAIDQMAAIGEDELEGLQEAYGRDWYMAQMQSSIRNQMHNLVENRQGIEREMIDYELWLKNEAQAQELNLWDYQGDPSPSGRGLDTLVYDVDTWLDLNYKGIIPDTTYDMLAQIMSEIWNNPNTLSQEEGEPDPETGETPERELVDEQQLNLLMQFATSGVAVDGQIIPGLGLTQGKATQFIDAITRGVENGRNTAFAVEGWKTAPRLEPGSAQTFAAIAEVAEEVYQDPETAQMIAQSDYVHRLIQMRSGGDVNHQGAGNQFGLFALPEHTYETMGYTVEQLTDNPELQIEAFLTFVGYWGGYGPGYEGLQAAVADLMHNPDTWGDV